VVENYEILVGLITVFAHLQPGDDFAGRWKDGRRSRALITSG
jgi:hypothetical protein